MATKRELLKSYFNVGDRPTESQFAELIDNTVNVVDDKANSLTIDVNDDIKYTTPKGVKKAIDSFAVLKVNNTAPTNGNVTVSDITGNAGTATKLQSARKINGIEFDGTTDITVPNITGNAGTATKLQTARRINNIPFDGTADITVPVARIIRIPNAVTNLSNVTTSQGIFNLNVISLPAGRTYLFRGKILLANGVVNHTTSLGFLVNNPLMSIEYVARLFSGTGIVTTQSMVQISNANNTVLNAPSVAPTTNIEFEGVIRTNLVTNIQPQIQFSAAPGGTNQLKVGSYIEFIDIGPNTFVS